MARPDADNLVKATVDALLGLCWADDAQLAWVDAYKLHAASDEQTGVQLVVRQLDGTELVPTHEV